MRATKTTAALALVMAGLTASFSGTTSASATQSAAARDSGPALDYSGVTLTGEPFDHTELRGNLVLLDFWAVWCAPCITAVPKLNDLQEELGDAGFEVIGMAVHSGAAEHVRTFADKHGIEYRVVVGPDDLAYEWGVIGYPSYFLLDRDGRQVRKYVGDIPDLKERVTKDVRALLNREASRP